MALSFQDKIKPTAPTGPVSPAPLSASSKLSFADKIKPVTTPAPAENVGFLQGMIRGIASPVLRGVANIASLADINNPEALKKDQQEGISYGDYLGKFRPIGSPVSPTGEDLTKTAGGFGRMVTDAVGTGAEAASYVVGGGEAANVVKQGLKGSIWNAAKTAAKSGAVSGALGLGGNEAQAPDSTVGSIAAKTALGGIVGAGTGLVAGAAGPMLGTNRADIAKKVEQDLENKYTELFTGQSPTKQKLFYGSQKASEMKNLAGTEGTPPQTTLAKAHVVPEQTGDKLTTLEQADSFRKTARPLQQVNRDALKEVEQATPKISLADQEEKAVQLIKTPRNINNGTAKGLEKEIRSEFYDLRDHYGNDVPITVLDDIKSARWQPIKFDKVDVNRPLLGDANYAIAKSAQQTIQDTAESIGNKDVAQLNRHIGDIMEGAKFLEGLNGKTVKGGGMTKLGIKIAGAAMGHSIPAKIAGYLGGDLIANMMIRNEISGPVQRLILGRLETSEPAAYKATIKWMEEQGIARDARLALPAPLSASEKIKTTGVNTLPKGNNPIPMMYPTSEANPLFNNFQQNNRRAANMKFLPAPSERIVTPNTTGTPNPMTLGGVDQTTIGGVRSRGGGVERLPEKRIFKGGGKKK